MAKTGEVVSPKMIPVVQGIVDWIEAHILDTLPVNTIAKKSGYSHWYFQRQFAMVTGCTLANYVSRRKMTIATIYLTQTQASIQSISQCLGYDGQAAFCRTFHRHFGMSPTRYRREAPGKEMNMQYPLTVEGKDAQVRRSAAVAADQDQRMVFGVMTRRAPT
ncbi:AraC family transcriptional regulator [Klebsiella variicola]|uniref:AraC family transcriptional regulator n=1 Tax=Klebsiella variicola TaxID=244366 RepID=UPI002B0598A5|nr:AraC family transcriptional regulator [Klebsiella variicola]